MLSYFLVAVFTKEIGHTNFIVHGSPKHTGGPNRDICLGMSYNWIKSTVRPDLGQQSFVCSSIGILHNCQQKLTEASLSVHHVCV